MPSTLAAIPWPTQAGEPVNTWHTIYTAPNGPADKTTLVTGLRVVNTATDGLSVEFDLEVNGIYLARGAHVLTRGAEDYAPGGTTLVLNKGNTVRIKVGTVDGIAVHLDVIERS